MRTLAILLLVPLLACTKDGPPCDSAPLACTCDGGRAGLAACAPDGQARLACDCSEQACPLKARTACQDRLFYDVDGCGNATLAGLCPCACSGETCGAWVEPASMTPGPGCQDLSGCFEHAPVSCEPLDDGHWGIGLRLANHCDVAVRCYGYAWSGEVWARTDGFVTHDIQMCIIPADGFWDVIEPGYTDFGGELFPTEAECQVGLARTSGPILYHACVPVTDPASCLPLFSRPLSCESLSHVCVP